MKALETQVGGNHYKSLAIQPVEYNQLNSLGYCEGSVVKYVTRWREKGGIQDLEKAKHFIDLLIDIEQKAALSEKQIEIEYNPEDVAFKHTINHDEEEAWREVEKRMDAIGQNGNGGEHYIPGWVSETMENVAIPEWAQRLRLCHDGEVWAYSNGASCKLIFTSKHKPNIRSGYGDNELWEVPK